MYEIGHMKDMSQSDNIHTTNDNKSGLDRMVLIPGGDFQMGNIESNMKNDEQQFHTVYIDAFYIDIYEVTNAEYKIFADENPEWKKENAYQGYSEGYLTHWRNNQISLGYEEHPVVFVSWYAAMAYAKWLGKRLPTEAEWEKAAREGLDYQQFSWGNSLPDGTQCNFADKNTDLKWSNKDVDDGYEWTAPVGSYPPNGYGLYDMTGNVAEWCLDKYHYQVNTNSIRYNPIGGAERINDVVENYRTIETERVMRGGAWDDDARFLQVTSRDNYPPINTEDRLGFRCVRDIPA